MSTRTPILNSHSFASFLVMTPPSSLYFLPWESLMACGPSMLLEWCLNIMRVIDRPTSDCSMMAWLWLIWWRDAWVMPSMWISLLYVQLKGCTRWWKRGQGVTQETAWNIRQVGGGRACLLRGRCKVVCSAYVDICIFVLTDSDILRWWWEDFRALVNNRGTLCSWKL